MNESMLRNELYSYYLKGDAERSKNFADKCFAIMDSRYTDGMSIVDQKLLQYDVITEDLSLLYFVICRIFTKREF